MNDIKYAELRNSCWKGTTADWVIVCDLDELLYFPEGAEESLGAYTRMGAAVPKPHGFEMFSETYPTGNGQIWDEIKFGAPDNKWYSKAILFNPRLVSDMHYGLGSHECSPRTCTMGDPSMWATLAPCQASLLAPSLSPHRTH